MFLQKEMCPEEIYRCSRVYLADRHPVAHPDCKRSPCVPGEPRIRRQRLLRTSGAKRAFLLAAQTRRAAASHSRGG